MNAMQIRPASPCVDSSGGPPDDDPQHRGGTDRHQQIAGRSGGGDDHELLTPVPSQVLNADRHWLCPADQRKIGDHRQQRKHDRADRIHVHGGVHRHPSEQPRRRVAELVRRPRVRRLVNREGNHEESELDKRVED